ncbi:sulfotransferase [Marinicella sp. S1101]|uniref:sulfotransferase domain-containing protein n=1 Tax=Marinicella marina TaxID=2996016 RepID=UPI002260C858|nr:sulfotransferase domain-containing protein [Marinicella marina]MCX7553237.1 sulfotransferase [Marinicella marina]MDJ1138969.1 sulfotransferase [Marinicella marina]
MSDKKVTVFVGGAQKSGTRSVTEMFRKLPQIAVQQSKEGHFFDRDEWFDELRPNAVALQTYHDDFKVTAQTHFLCDVSPDYIFRNQAVARIHCYNPQAKWILLLRNPIDRAFSAWNMEVNRKTENLSFEAALEMELSGQSDSRSHDRFAYIGRSRYHQQLEHLWRFFPKSQCHIWPAEWVWENPTQSIYQSLSALGISGLQTTQMKHVHKGKYRNQATAVANDILQQELAFEMNHLHQLLGWHQNPWMTE